MSRSWILTGSPENHAATRDRDVTVIGVTERNRSRALQIGRPGMVGPCPWLRLDRMTGAAVAAA